MRTKFDVGQTVYFFDPNKEIVSSEKIEVIIVTAEEIIYKVGEINLPERLLFSCELQCTEHYKKIFL